MCALRGADSLVKMMIYASIPWFCEVIYPA